MAGKTAFLILSCDAYSGLWDAHFRCLDQFWPDCPFPKYLLTNHKESGRSDISTIKAGDDLGWSANLKKALETLRKEYDFVLVTFDDLFLVEEVNGRILESVLDSFHSLGGQFLQLIQWQNKPIKVNQLLGLIESGSLYRPNCVYSMWDIEVLDNLLLPEETAWEFEKKGSARSDQHKGFYVVLDSIFYYRNTVIRGKIVRKDARLFNLSTTGKLRIMSNWDNIRFQLRYQGFRLFLFLVPRTWQAPLARLKTRLLNS